MKYQKGYLIGRFQPLHKDHLRTLKGAEVICEEIIPVGVKYGYQGREFLDKGNPFTFEEREELFESNGLELKCMEGEVENILSPLRILES